MSAKKIFINLPVRDLARSIAFYTQLGCELNRQFTDETAACLVISEEIYVMLLTEAKFLTFIPGPISDAKKATEVLNCLTVDSRPGVDEFIAKAVAAGATTFCPPTDYGFMYGHSFQDLDGHIWECVWLDPEVASGQKRPDEVTASA